MENDIANAIKENNTYTFAMVTDANYTIYVKVTDQNDKYDDDEYLLTIDTKAPEAPEDPKTNAVNIAGFFDKIVENDGKKKGIIKTEKEDINTGWKSFVDRIYEIFANVTVTVTLSAEDSISDVKLYYLMTDKEYTEAQLKDMEDNEWTAYDPDNKPKTKLNQREFVYMKAEDQSGNDSYFNSKGIITDTVAPSIDTQLSKEANANKFYNGDVTLHVNVSELTDSTQAGASGLRYVGYRVESGGEVTESKAIIDKPTSETEKSFDIHLSAEKHNRNDIKVYITAIDNAGNRKPEEPISLRIDSARPEISVTYNDEKGSRYYNHTRTATITIKERNLDTGDVDINIRSEHGSKAAIGKWSHTDNIGKSDEAVYTCQVTFGADDDYEFSVDCVDKAGNKAYKAFSDKFTVDKTVPAINVSYSNSQIEENGYYNEAVTATVTIEEHNFDAGKADIRIGSEAGAISSSGFSNNGDIHTASVVFDRDGTYSLQVAFTDEAGNVAEAYQGNTFHIDLKNPEIIIHNVKDKSANKDDVKPVITCTDENYDMNQVSLTVYGSNSGEIGLEKLGLESRSVANGEEFSLTFPKEEAMDDVYTLTAKMEDKAGNHTSNVSNKHSESELEILFAIDQTAPSAVVTGTENGASYSQSSHTVLLDVQDNLALNTVSVYLNGEEYATYDAEEISELEDGLIPVVVEESISTQTIQLKATDMAGNVLGKDTDGKYDAEFEDFKLLVTNNVLASIMHSYWIFIIVALVAACAVIAVIIVRCKNEKIPE